VTFLSLKFVTNLSHLRAYRGVLCGYRL